MLLKNYQIIIYLCIQWFTFLYQRKILLYYYCFKILNLNAKKILKISGFVKPVIDYI